eukprot:Platyproteum_vivax@DN2871_c0_g1_i1.p1
MATEIEKKRPLEESTTPDAKKQKVGERKVQNHLTSEEIEKLSAEERLAEIKKQIEYYLSDDNMKYEEFFRLKMDSDNWLNISFINNSPKMVALHPTLAEIREALKTSDLETRDTDTENFELRRTTPLPPLIQRKNNRQKKDPHSNGIILLIKKVPAEVQCQKLKRTLQEQLKAAHPGTPESVVFWTSSVTDGGECVMLLKPFENDQDTLSNLELEVNNTKLTLLVPFGDVLQRCMKLVNKNVFNKHQRGTAPRKQLPPAIVVPLGDTKFKSTKEIQRFMHNVLQNTAAGTELGPTSANFKVARALIDFHPKAAQKTKDLAGLLVDKFEDPAGAGAGKKETKCLFVKRTDGSKEDVSYVKCIQMVEGLVQGGKFNQKVEESKIIKKPQKEDEKVKEADKENEAKKKKKKKKKKVLCVDT